MKKLALFIKSHYLLTVLLLYGLFIAFFRATHGSFDCDEAIYSQIAREGLAKHSYLNLYWKDQLWFEKPPLMIWLTMLSFKLFGISEFTARIFSGLFGILGAIVTYFLGKELGQNKLAGFLSGYVLLTIPLYIWSMRSNMMDTALSFFIALSMLALWKTVHEKEKWLLIFWISVGLAVMTKSAAGLLPIILALPIIVFFRKTAAIFKSQYFYLGLGIFLTIIFPWHLYMTFLYGKSFWSEYVGYHVIDRFSSSILHTPWDNNPFAYLDIFFQRSGIWSLITVLVIILSLKNLIRKDERIWFIVIWTGTLVISLSLLTTKLPQYLIPIYIPVSLLIGISLFELIKKKSKFLLIITLLFFLNFLPFFFISVSDYGESSLLIPRIVAHIFSLNTLTLSLILSVSVLLFIISWIKIDKRKRLWLSIGIIIMLSIAIPFKPERNAATKQIAMKINEINDNKPVILYFRSSGIYPMKQLFPVYLPLGSKTEIYNEKNISLAKVANQNNGFCFIEKQFVTEDIANIALFSNQVGTLVYCSKK